MFRFLLLAVALVGLGTVPAAAQDGTLSLGGDVFGGGSTVVHAVQGADDLFLAGETVRIEAAITGTAHAAGRQVVVAGAVGESAYGAGMEVEVSGPVSGDATLAGYEVTLSGDLGGDLRATGAKISVLGDVGGYALLGGDEVRLDGAVTGDVSLSARRLEFGPDAIVGGRLIVYEETPGSIEIPASVVPEARVERRQIEDWQADTRAMRVFSWQRAVGKFLIGVVVVAAIAAAIAAIAPRGMAAMRARILQAPLRTAWFGFLALSVLVGSGLVLAVTLIGLLLTPAALLLAVLGALVGYVLGTYAFGVGLMKLAGRGEPATMGHRALAAALGALVAGLIALIPLLGWLFVLALTLAGIGALTIRAVRPAFFTG